MDKQYDRIINVTILKGRSVIGPYIFVLATILAIIPILIVFKIAMEKIKADPRNREKAQVKFFIGAFLSEVLPIILVIYGFINLSPVETINELYLPGMIILLMIGFAAFFIFLQRMVDVEDDTKDIINIFVLIGLAITNSIPIMSIVALFTMIP